VAAVGRDAGAQPMVTPDILNREHWLERLVQGVMPIFREAELEVPPVHISVGFPSKNALGKGSRRIGECWAPTSSPGGIPNIFISPLLVDPVKVAGVTIHELLHAAVGVEAGHKGPFKRGMKKVGLTGKATATDESPELVERLKGDILPVLGDYPHAGLVFTGKEKKQTTRMLKVTCSTCGYTARTTKQWLDKVGPPLCPCNGEAMVAEEKEEGE
jgi:hypothetical protein